jgi:hypothetical protein
VATDTPKGRAAERFRELAEKLTRRSSKPCNWARSRCWRRRWPSSRRWA